MLLKLVPIFFLLSTLNSFAAITIDIAEESRFPYLVHPLSVARISYVDGTQEERKNKVLSDVEMHEAAQSFCKAQGFKKVRSFQTGTFDSQPSQIFNYPFGIDPFEGVSQELGVTPLLRTPHPDVASFSRIIFTSLVCEADALKPIIEKQSEIFLNRLTLNEFGLYIQNHMGLNGISQVNDADAWSEIVTDLATTYLTKPEEVLKTKGKTRVSRAVTQADLTRVIRNCYLISTSLRLDLEEISEQKGDDALNME